MAALYDFTEIIKGDTFTGLIFTATDETGTSIDLTGCSLDLWFRFSNSSGDVEKRISVNDGITILNASEGRFQIDKFNVDFEAGIYVYDLQYTNAAGDITTLIYGSWLINEDSTD